MKTAVYFDRPGDLDAQADGDTSGEATAHSEGLRPQMHPTGRIGPLIPAVLTWPATSIFRKRWGIMLRARRWRRCRARALNPPEKAVDSEKISSLVNSRLSLALTLTP